MKTHEVRYECDRCKKWTRLAEPNEWEFPDGWTVSSDRDLCKKCSEELQRFMSGEQK